MCDKSEVRRLNFDVSILVSLITRAQYKRILLGILIVITVRVSIFINSWYRDPSTFFYFCKF